MQLARRTEAGEYSSFEVNEHKAFHYNKQNCYSLLKAHAHTAHF